MVKSVKIFKAEIQVDSKRTIFCYRYGCNHWYLCITDPREEGMDKCHGFIGDESKKSYKKYRID
jgi:hypothetical protein